MQNNIVKSVKSGARKARRDIRLAEAYLRDKRYVDPDDTFWASLGRDLDREDGFEVAAYRDTKDKWMQQWWEDNQAKADLSAFESRIRQSRETPMAHLTIAGIIEACGDGLTAENVEHTARKHGHTTEDECQMIIMLRTALTVKNARDANQ